MRMFSIGEIAAATGGRIISGSGDGRAMRVSKDSREVTPDTLFFALVGQNHDAHKFLPQVLANGCANWVVSNPDAALFEGAERANIVLVDDTEQALVDLAVFVLDEMKAVKVGVTGSVGKTSTKDMIHAVCSRKYPTGKTRANLNTNIGIAMSVLDFEPDTKVAVLEMGTDHPGEIDRVAQVFRPHICLITNIGQSHLEHFGTREGIFKAKMEITNYFNESSLLIIQQGEDFLQKKNIPTHYRVWSVGSGPDNDFTVADIEITDGTSTRFTLSHQGESVRIQLPVLGAHHAFNAAQAAAVGLELGIPMEEAAIGLASLRMTAGRLDLKDEKGYRNSVVIDDSYNASPDSMRAGIKTLMSLDGPRKVAILGDMFELGDNTQAYHSEVGTYAKDAGVDLVLGVGDLAKALVDSAGSIGIHFQNKQALIDALPQLIMTDDVILVKASRGMALDEVVEHLLSTKENQ
jgi:UDP-N-acetylmuramoyl-tripeptide--D-alanyl-D-alanine ligase